MDITNKKRVILIVLDSLGIGGAVDGCRFKDHKPDTLGNIIKSIPDIAIPNLTNLGLLNINNVLDKRKAVPKTLGAYCRVREKSLGKDTITGHWEITGVEVKEQFKTYPDGFPKEFIAALEKKCNTKFLGNYVASGTEIIEDLGPLHEKTGAPIIYTSADSVFQIAANTEVVSIEKLYYICQIARELLVGKWACGRVIARPYVLADGKRQRSSQRKDYAVTPPRETLLDTLHMDGKQVIGVGKISDIFNGKGVDLSIHTDSNMDGITKTIDLIKKGSGSLIFTNLVDFDSLFGHRRDVEGYGKALEEFDRFLPEIYASMTDKDILMICADHGNDPTYTGFDHTREDIPWLIYGKRIIPNINLGTAHTFGDIGATIGEYLNVKYKGIGLSHLDKICGTKPQ